MSRFSSKIVLALILAVTAVSASGCVTPLTIDCSGAPTLTCTGG
jgi:hypothetical protein